SKTSSAQRFCTHEYHHETQKVVALKQLPWKKLPSITILDPDPQIEEDQRCTFYTMVSLDGIPLAENMIVDVLTNEGERRLGRICELFQLAQQEQFMMRMDILQADE